MRCLFKQISALSFLPIFIISLLFSPDLKAQQRADSQDELWPIEDLSLEALMSLRLRASADLSRDLLHTQTDLDMPVRALLGSQISLGSHYGGRVVLAADSHLGQLEASRFFVDEAYLDATMQMGPGLARWRLGRQALLWGGGRLVSDEDFAQQAPRLDALRLNVALRTFELDVFASRLGMMAALSAQNNLSELDERDLVAAARLSWDPGRMILLAAETMVLLAEAAGPVDLLSVEGNQAQRSQLAFAGLDISLQPMSLLHLHTAATLQFGEHRGLRHLAYDLALATSLAAFWSAQDSLDFGYDLSSGDGQPLDNRSSVFINPLGLRHARYGRGDFLAPENATDLWLRLQSQRKQGTAALSVHRLALFDARGSWIDATGQQLAPRSTKLDALLGYELDLFVEAALRKPLWLGLTYAMFVPASGAQQRRGAELAHRLLVELCLRY